MRRSIALALVAGSLAVAPATAAAQPPHVGCPPSASGYQVWDVDTEPYQVDNAVDANGDGFVCARPVDGQTFVVGGVEYPVYNFIDDVIAT